MSALHRVVQLLVIRESLAAVAGLSLAWRFIVKLTSLEWVQRCGINVRDLIDAHLEGRCQNIFLRVYV
jgi:hypothetical protein